MKPVLIKLNNGLRIVLALDEKIKSVNYSFMFGTDSVEFIEKNGLAHLVEHCIMDNSAIDKTHSDLEMQNSGLCGETFPEYTIYSGLTYYKNIYKAINLIKQILFPSDGLSINIDDRKKVVYEELNSCLDDPEYEKYIQMVGERYIGKITPGLSSIGSKDKIDKTTAKDINLFYNKYYNSNNLIISISGNFDQKKIEKVLKVEFREIKNHSKNEDKKPEVIYSEKKIKIVKKKQNTTSICITFPGFSWQDGDKKRITENLITAYLSGYRSSVLFKELRTNSNMIYSIDTSTYMNKTSGIFSIEWDCSNDNLQSSIQKVIGILMNLSIGDFDYDY